MQRRETNTSTNRPSALGALLLVAGCHSPAAPPAPRPQPALPAASASASGAAGKFAAYRWLASGLVEGSASNEQPRDVTFDAAGNIVLVGGTSSRDFPTTPGAYDRELGGAGRASTGTAGDMDAFVTKIGRDGRLIWSTYLGGPGYDRAYAVEVGPEGDVFVAGRAGEGFPTTPGVVQPAFAGDSDPNSAYGKQDGFVARLSADGSRLLWSTYFGGGGRGFLRDMDVDASGQTYLALSEESTALGVTPEQAGPRSAPLGPSTDGYYGKLSSDGKRLLFGTFFGGSSGAADGVNPSIRVADDGSVYLVAYTDSSDVDCITPGAYQPRAAGGMDLLLMRYTPKNQLAFCTYLGGSRDDYMETHGLALAPGGRVVLAGGTRSSDFPTTPSAVQPHVTEDHAHGFVAVMSEDGTRLLAGTYVGDHVEGVAVAPDGDIVFGGGADHPLPLTDNALRRELVAREAMLGRLSPDLGELRFLSYFGGSGSEEMRGLDVGPRGEVAYAGHTGSQDFPCKNAFDSTLGPDETERAHAPFYLLLEPVLRP